MKKILFFVLLLLLLTGCEQNPVDEKHDIFKEDLLAVTTGSGTTWGYIDTKGNLVIPYQFHGATAFYQGLAIVLDDQNRANLINKQGEFILEHDYNSIYRDDQTMLFIVEDNGKYGLLGIDGKKIIDLIYDEIQPFSEELAVVKQDDQYGYINTKGQIVIKPSYEKAKPFSNGYAAVSNANLFGYINRKNELMIDYQYRGASDFNCDGKSVVTILEGTIHQFYLIDKLDNKIIDNVVSIKGSCPIYGVTTTSGSYLYKSDGTLFVDTVFDDINDVDGYYVHAILNGVDTFLYYKSNGEVITSKVNEGQLYRTSIDYEDHYILQTSTDDMKHIYIDEKEIVLNSGNVFQVVSDELFITANREYNAAGMINSKNEVVIDYVYQTLYQGSDGYVLMRRYDYYGLLSPKYDVLVQPMYVNVCFSYNLNENGYPLV